MRAGRFPWAVFRRFAFTQAMLALAAILASGLSARYFFKREFLNQSRQQLRDALVSMEPVADALGRGSVPSEWCRLQKHGLSFRMVLLRGDSKRGLDMVCESDAPVQRPDFRRAPVFSRLISELEETRANYADAETRDPAFGERSLISLQPLSADFILLAVLPLSRLNEALGWFDTSLAIALLAIVLVAWGIGFWSSGTLVSPLARLLSRIESMRSSAGWRGKDRPEKDKQEDEEEDAYGEWSSLESAIEEIRRDFRAQEDRLAVERGEQAQLMSSISDAILTVDADERPVFFNDRFSELFGVRSVTERLSLSEIFREPEILERFRQALREGAASKIGAVPVQQGARRLYFSVAVAPLTRSEGKPYGAVGVFHDVTELKRAEQIRIDFVANVSHELRTPLTSIKGYTDTLVQDLASGRGADRSFVEAISRNVERLMNLVQDLLDLSSLESGDAGESPGGADLIHKQELSAHEFSQRVIRQLSDRFQARRQKVELSAGSETILADPRRLEQVLVNLLDNACKYTPEGGSITVSWEQESGPSGPGTLLKVKDTGPGIPLEHQPRLFERFYRVDKARSREMGGTGLGLAIVKHIVQRHGGAIWVDSTPGHGATFICRFPAA